MDFQKLIKDMRTKKEAMKPQERLRAYLKGEEVDHIPYAMIGEDSMIGEIYGYTTRQMARDFELRVEVMKRKEEDFGLSDLTVGLGLRSLGECVGSRLLYPEYGASYVKEYALKEYDDIEKIQITNPYQNEKMVHMIQYGHRIWKIMPDLPMKSCVAGPLTTAAAIRPIEMILRDTRKNPELLHRLLEYSVEGSLQWIRMFRKEFGEADVFISDPVTCMNMISKKQFMEFSFPYLKKLVQGITEIMGRCPSIHICGKTKPIWKEIAACGVSSFSIDNCESLKEAKEMIGDSVRLEGNVPPVDVLRAGSIDDVVESCRQCIQDCADSPRGFILNTGCQPPIGTPRENVEAFVFAARMYGKCAKIGSMPEGICEMGAGMKK